MITWLKRCFDPRWSRVALTPFGRTGPLNTIELKDGTRVPSDKLDMLIPFGTLTVFLLAWLSEPFDISRRLVFGIVAAALTIWMFRELAREFWYARRAHDLGQRWSTVRRGSALIPFLIVIALCVVAIGVVLAPLPEWAAQGVSWAGMTLTAIAIASGLFFLLWWLFAGERFTLRNTANDTSARHESLLAPGDPGPNRYGPPSSPVI